MWWNPTVYASVVPLLGEPEKARAYYLQTLENCAKIGFRPEAALAHLGLAELGLGTPVGATHASPLPGMERPEAIRHLDIALREFMDPDASGQPSLERALKHRELLKA